MLWTRMRNEPFSATMSRPFELFNRALTRREERNAHRGPAFNIWASEEGAVMTSEIPGVDLESLEISVAGRDVSIKGTRVEESAENEKVVRRERGKGTFERSFQLPFQIDSSKVEATLNNGVLEVSLPRAENDKPHKITITAG